MLARTGNSAGSAKPKARAMAQSRGLPGGGGPDTGGGSRGGENVAVQVSLTAEEFRVLETAVRHCLMLCREGGPQSGCPDCASLQGLLEKLRQAIDH